MKDQSGPAFPVEHEAMAYCHRCERTWRVVVSEQDLKTGTCFAECECGKSGAFGLINALLAELGRE